MGFFNSSKQSSGTTTVVPPEIMARVSVMSDHMAEVGAPPSDIDEPLRVTTSIPLGAIEMPHGPFSAENPALASAPTTNVQPVSQESVESSPFLQTLAPEALIVTEKVKPQVESPMFLSDKKQAIPFGFGQTSNLPPALTLSQVPKNEKKENNLVLQDSYASSGQKTWWMLAIFLVFLLVSLGGAYYYFYVYGGKSQDGLGDMNTQPAPVVPTPEKNKPDFDFSLISPNYLSVNVETVSAEGLRAQLEGIGSKMKLAHITTPVEFFVTDQTNTPVAFSRFVVLMGLKLPQNVVSTTEEKFSLFLFNDQGKSRVGLRISLKDGKIAPELLKKAEIDFPVVFQNLFLESKVVLQKKYLYKESSYNGIKIRYVNISEPEMLSVDYSVDGNSWFVGTSKNSLRALLDAQKK
ncbi:MAG: hypothetical protein QG606_364 [Patescibacteria group bacterium]|nr:hypothetical protein [Patescibacteria group bacterium]